MQEVTQTERGVQRGLSEPVPDVNRRKGQSEAYWAGGLPVPPPGAPQALEERERGRVTRRRRVLRSGWA